ncbi:MAG: hypothetical protein HC852_23305 [Acaryochloridaceae cyanobacterium RU_4_10]|nr:hypothetical protein [Acaryochloridaceae cyanobacterium RU_4_10]
MSKTDSAIRDQAYQFFEQEALELLQVLEDGLLTLRTQSDLPHVHQLMRAAHSIKGGQPVWDFLVFRKLPIN